MRRQGGSLEKATLQEAAPRAPRRLLHPCAAAGADNLGASGRVGGKLQAAKQRRRGQGGPHRGVGVMRLGQGGPAGSWLLGPLQVGGCEGQGHRGGVQAREAT